MIVGHDPGMQGLAWSWQATGMPELQALAAKFPTAGLAVIRFKARDWAKVGPGKGRLELFMTPKTLLDCLSAESALTLAAGLP